MKPLPKYVGWLALIAGLLAPGGALFDLLPPKYAATVAGVAAVILSITHSLNGTGGTENNP